ncbi:hypothetical protein GCM10007937_36980 [Mesorhizobium albiziae]|nr:hypothetical protein GCM10007937_36980 [Mesorhizobium albiziae]
MKNCLIGRIAHKFRDWSPPPIWENGADRLIVCTDASQPAIKSDMPEKLQKLVPGCLSVKRDGAVCEEGDWDISPGIPTAAAPAIPGSFATALLQTSHVARG